MGQDFLDVQLRACITPNLFNRRGKTNGNKSSIKQRKNWVEVYLSLTFLCHVCDPNQLTYYHYKKMIYHKLSVQYIYFRQEKNTSNIITNNKSRAFLHR